MDCKTVILKNLLILYFFFSFLDQPDTDRRNSIVMEEEIKEDLNLSVRLFPFQIQAYENDSKIKYLELVNDTFSDFIFFLLD